MLPHSQTQVWGQAGQALCHRHAALPPQWAAPRPHQPSQRQVRESQKQRTNHCGAQRRVHTLAAGVVEGPASAEAPQQGSGLSEGIRLTEERLPNSRMRVSVEVPATSVRWYYERVLQSSRKNLDIPGFRKGKKVPDSVVVRHLGGQAETNRFAIESIFKGTMPAALKRFEQTAVSESEKIEENIEQLLAGFSLDGPLAYSVTLDVMPTVAWRQPYKGIQVEVPAAGDQATAAAAVDKRLAAAQREKGKLRIVVGRPLRAGDVAIIDFAAARTDGPGDPEPVLGSQKRGMQLDTASAADTINIPGLVEGMEGMVVGDERSIDSVFPETWHEPQSLRGVPCRCDIKVNELFEWDLPQLDDEFAEALYPDCGGLDKLRGIMEAAEMRMLDSQMKQKVHEALTAALAERVDAEVPLSVMRELGSQEYQAKLLEAQARGKLSFEAVQQLATEELLEQYIESRQDDLRDIQRATMGIDAVYAAEGLQVPEAEVEAEYSSAASEFTASGQEFDEQRLREQVVEALKAAVTLDWLERHSEVVLTAPARS